MLLTIYTENPSNVNFQKQDNSIFTDLNESVIYLVQTLSYSEAEVALFQQILSPQEQQKAERFRFQKDRQSYIVTHAMLRKILGNYTASDPAKLEFILNEYGKPSLAENPKEIYFNLSHCSGLSALAFTVKSEIGIDIEKIDPEFDFDLIAKAHFSDAENSFIDHEPPESRKRFYTVWTRKESLLKAIGTGIAENLDVEVFRKVNYYNPELPLSINIESDYYLTTCEYQNKYLISAAGKDPGAIYCLIDNLK